MSVLLNFSLLLLFLNTRTTNAQSGHLPPEEVLALFEIGEQLGKADWNININPCDGNQNWNTTYNDARPLYNNSLICNWSYTGGVCHVEKLYLKGQDLTGVVPQSVAKLPFLKIIDLTRNYLSGTIPPEWASTRLEYMSLEDNLFSGFVPPELGNLSNLVNLLLSGNELTGMLPSELYHLTQLKELRISRNYFNGTLPSLNRWSKLVKLEILGSGLAGPMPSNISLSNLEDLRISDLHGDGSKFPRFINMPDMKMLLLRSCILSGRISSDLLKMPLLKMIDLSYNMLEGEVPDIGSLEKLKTL